jgi:transcriptional regulator with XRE-family HTH domain
MNFKNHMAFDNKLQMFLKKKLEDKLKRKEFIESSGIPKSTVSKIINASHRTSDLKTILKIADYFNCTIDKVLKRKNDLPKNINISKLPFDEINSNLRKFLKDRLSNLSFNSYELSKNCGLSPDAIRHFIRKIDPQKTLGIAVIIALADYFKVSIDEMIGRVPQTRHMQTAEETKEGSK